MAREVRLWGARPTADETQRAYETARQHAEEWQAWEGMKATPQAWRAFIAVMWENMSNQALQLHADLGLDSVAQRRVAASDLLLAFSHLTTVPIFDDSFSRQGEASMYQKVRDGLDEARAAALDELSGRVLAAVLELVQAAQPSGADRSLLLALRRVSEVPLVTNALTAAWRYAGSLPSEERERARDALTALAGTSGTLATSLAAVRAGVAADKVSSVQVRAAAGAAGPSVRAGEPQQGPESTLPSARPTLR